ncbi:hypothetical protein [Streptomyces sp. CB01881]|uniref:hypothetical protein n=1 Tax=Streptomyces sp. CB01881 TaxID=2078691 RepID=UPI000CDBABBB|nr:hypothetical protein [Streptomyces sp. CB01881]AUY50525.1 hypothetical protein C2142_18050 [Streptomyces sp. CB01881]TYC75202.1 hypothetical protein EH183_18030 [Streptomyces sp. CB01881]
MQHVTVVRTSVLPPYAAHLRVYEPLAAYPEPERAHWQAYAAERGPDAAEAGQPVAAAVLEEQRAALAELVGRTPRPLPERESERAFVRSLDGVLYVCPWATRLRSWQALEELRTGAPVALVDTALPPATREAAEADRERWRAEHPDARPWILTSRWEVPVRWFLPFGEEDRCFVPAGAAEEGTGRPGEKAALFYLTPMAQARRRVARAYRALREAVPEGELVRGAERVGRWLEEFHPRSLVELDYGGLVHLLGPERLLADRSAGELEDGLRALRAGDAAEAERAYEELAGRWRRVLALRYAN